MPEIISRKDAKARGLKRYFTGKVCGGGHVAERYAKSKQCCECCKSEKRRDYQREYHAMHREESMERSRRHYVKNIEKYRKAATERRAKNSSAASEYRRKVADVIAVLRAENPELLKEFGL